MALVWTSRLTKLTALAIAAMLIGGLCWFSITVRNADRCIVHSMLVSSVLKAYAKDHQGWLPSSLNELIETGYIRCDNGGELCGIEAKVGFQGQFEVSLFGIAWGATADQTNENGYMSARGRYLIVPAQGSPCELTWCEGTSKQVAQAMKSAAPSAQSRPR